VKEGASGAPQDGLARAVMDGQVRRIIGVDPGRTFIMVTAEMVDGVLRTFRLTGAVQGRHRYEKLWYVGQPPQPRVRAQAYLDEISLK
jgi:hypothetical protein